MTQDAPQEPNLKPTEAFLNFARELGLEFEPGDLDRLSHYLGLLLETNEKFNLTAIKDPAQAWTRHFADSLTLLPYLVTAKAKSVIDVGAGGGFPGMPLAILMGEVHFMLLEATGKKAKFLREAVQTLGLGNVEVIRDRAEDLGRDEEDHRAQYDVAIARAVGRLPVLLELTVPLVKIGGHVMAIKGEQAEAEIEEARKALHMLHCHITETKRTATGTVVIIEKMRKTPNMYPRFPGEPKRAPLGGGPGGKPGGKPGGNSGEAG